MWSNYCTIIANQIGLFDLCKTKKSKCFFLALQLAGFNWGRRVYAILIEQGFQLLTNFIIILLEKISQSQESVCRTNYCILYACSNWFVSSFNIIINNSDLYLPIGIALTYSCQRHLEAHTFFFLLLLLFQDSSVFFIWWDFFS